MTQGFILLLVSMFAALITITLHEFPKAAMATLLGDKTAKYQGKLTLNPFKHMDPIGYLFMVGTSISSFTLTLMSIPTVVSVGWSYPVEFNPHNFKNPKRDTWIVATSGMITSIVVGIACLVALRFMGHDFELASVNVVYNFLLTLGLQSLGIAVINIIPVVPFSITKIISVMAPRKYFWLIQHEKMIQMAFLMIYFIGVIPQFVNRIIFPIVRWIIIL